GGGTGSAATGTAAPGRLAESGDGRSGGEGAVPHPAPEGRKTPVGSGPGIRCGTSAGVPRPAARSGARERTASRPITPAQRVTATAAPPTAQSAGWTGLFASGAVTRGAIGSGTGAGPASSGSGRGRSSV